MKNKNFKTANYLGWIVIVLAFAFIYFSYFFVYIPKQKSDLTQRAFRILKEYGNNMVGKYDYYETHFKNYGVYYSLKYFQELSQITVPNSENADYKKIKSVVQSLFPYVITDTNNQGSNSNAYSVNTNKLYLNFLCKKPDAESINKLNEVYEMDLQQIGVKQKLDLLFNSSLTYHVPIENFMEGLKFDELFENIILFDDLKVYYNSNLDNLADITNPRLLCDTTNKSQGGVYKTLNIRGNDKHIMVLPIDFDGKRYFIGGLITDTDFKNITRTYNSRILILVAGFILLIFVGMPVLKTMFIGPKERLNTLDVASSAVSILFGSALFVLIVISLFKNHFVDRTELSKRIEMISDSLISNVTHDINSIKILGNSIAQGESSPDAPLAELVINKFNSEVSFFQMDKLNSPFPLNEIILIDSLGFVKKAVTRTAFSDAVAINLSKRPYFKNAADINLAWPTMKNSHFFLESIQSYNTGNFETAISFNTSRYKNGRVLAVTSEIPSFYKQVLPKDIEFVVINKMGKVLYHSKKSKNLHENFIEECDSDPAILNAIQLRVKDRMQIKYNEKKWLARIVPIEDTPLYHITLLDLNQTDNKNARIFLITFYFMIGLQIVTIGGFFLLRITFHKNKNEPNVFRFLNWLAYLPSKYEAYKGLLVILALIAAAGISSFVIQANLVNVLLLQFLSVGFTFFASLLFLKRDEITYENYFKGKYFPENLIFACLGILIILCFWKLESAKSLAIPLIILLITTLIIPTVFSHFNNERKNQINSVPSMKKIKSTYLAVLFLWLTIFSVIPVIHSYFSVRYFEEKLWKQQQLFKVAGDNVLLLKSEKDFNSAWFKRAQGNGIDRMKVDYVPTKEKTDKDLPKGVTNFTTSELLYASLPDPITNGYSHRELLAGKNQETEWNLTDDSLYFPGSDKKGTIHVTAGKKPTTAKGHLLLMGFVFLLAAICIWHLVRFAATVFLNLDNEKPKLSNINWLNFLNNEIIPRILLKTFNGEIFLTETVNSFRNNAVDANIIESIQAIKFCDSGFNSESYLKNAGKIIWICGLNECIPEIAKHNTLLDSFMAINHDHTKKIVVDLPFELKIIDEFYDEYIASNELSAKELTDIFILRKRWKIIFEDYISYDGFLYQFKTDEPQNKLPEEQIRSYCQNINHEWCYSNIWGNLTNYEKIVLYDLADDGLMNRNNRSVIRQLTEKKLILIKPFPVLFSRDFNDFIYQRISKSEIKAIEGKLGLKGNWRNAKYLILLVLIPLAAFIFISQGLTIEKSFGIFAGIVGAITTLMKLFETTGIKK
jgi:hypothetical protein